jgi:cell division protein FtsN
MNPSRVRAPRRTVTQSGNTILGFVIGLVAGLALAVAVAIYITNAPLPFINKVKAPAAANVTEPGGQLPDPNKSLNPSTGKAPPPSSVAALPPAAAPAPAAPAAAPPGPPPAAAVKGDAPKDEPVVEGTRFLLQAGAFKSTDEADGMRARLALIGLDARVFPVEQSGQTLYRVRLGPYGQLDDVNRVRKLLAENSIDAQIVRLR